MRFRPCIDIHNGKVKQIVGGSLKDQGDRAAENFVSEMDGAYYADFYKKDGLKGGHIILLNPASSPYYEATKQQALLALGAYPGGFQLGGGITPDNAKAFLDAGASHVIVTSYVFRDGKISTDNLRRMLDCVGKEHLVLDLSCRKKDGAYYVVTDRWQKFTETKVTADTLEWLRDSCANSSFTRWMWRAKPPALRCRWWSCWPIWTIFRVHMRAVWAASRIWPG